MHMSGVSGAESGQVQDNVFHTGWGEDPEAGTPLGDPPQVPSQNGD